MTKADLKKLNPYSDDANKVIQVATDIIEASKFAYGQQTPARWKPLAVDNWWVYGMRSDAMRHLGQLKHNEESLMRLEGYQTVGTSFNDSFE